MDPAFAQYGLAGITVGIVITGMRVLWKQYLDTRKELRANAADCVEREKALVERVQSLEDSRNADLSATIHAAMDALRMSASALHENSGTFRLLTEETGKHRTITRDEQP